MINTKIEYLYRDADNYKQYNSVIFSGAIPSLSIDSLADRLDEGKYFIPSRLGLEDLQHRMVDGYNPSVDHPYHELVEIVEVHEPVTDTRSIDAFMMALRSAVSEV